MVNFAGNDICSRNRNGADELGTKDIVVLDVELNLSVGVGNRDTKVLVPNGVFGVGDDPGAGKGGSC